MCQDVLLDNEPSQFRGSAIRIRGCPLVQNNQAEPPPHPCPCKQSPRHTPDTDQKRRARHRQRNPQSLKLWEPDISIHSSFSMLRMVVQEGQVWPLAVQHRAALMAP